MEAVYHVILNVLIIMIAMIQMKQQQTPAPMQGLVMHPVFIQRPAADQVKSSAAANAQLLCVQQMQTATMQIHSQQTHAAIKAHAMQPVPMLQAAAGEILSVRMAKCARIWYVFLLMSAQLHALKIQSAMMEMVLQ